MKEKAIIFDKLWKDAGRPRSGPLFSRRSSDKRAYKSAIRNHESDSVGRYTNSVVFYVCTFYFILWAVVSAAYLPCCPAPILSE